tara:strand:- start:19732 stop:20010 length:279 start_codon:yes stop_codon:yes gene_type:complete
MSIVKGDIVAVVNIAGEYVGKVSDDNDVTLILEKPRMVVNGEQGLGFARGICVTGEADPVSGTFYNSGIVFVTKVNAEIEKAYIEAVTGIII